MIKLMKPVIWLCYGGSSVDGAGPGEFELATTSKDEAKEFWEQHVVPCGSYSVGRVKPIFRDRIGNYIYHFTDKKEWDKYE